MIERIVCIALLVIAIICLFEISERDSKLRTAAEINTGLAEAIERRDVELQEAYNEAQCYHEECVRLAFEYMSDTIYTLPCNGREIRIYAEEAAGKQDTFIIYNNADAIYDVKNGCWILRKRDDGREIKIGGAR